MKTDVKPESDSGNDGSMLTVIDSVLETRKTCKPSSGGCGSVKEVKEFYRKGRNRVAAICKDCTRRQRGHRYRAGLEMPKPALTGARSASMSRGSRRVEERSRAVTTFAYAVPPAHFAQILAIFADLKDQRDVGSRVGTTSFYRELP